MHRATWLPGTNMHQVPGQNGPYYREYNGVKVLDKTPIPKDLSYYNKDAAAKAAAVPNFSEIVQKMPKERSKKELDERIMVLKSQAEAMKSKYKN